MSYRVEVRERGGADWSTNALRFRTRQEAEAYGQDLYSRWMGIDAVRAVRDPSPATDGFRNGRLVHGEDRRRHPAGRAERRSQGRLLGRSGSRAARRRGVR